MIEDFPLSETLLENEQLKSENEQLKCLHQLSIKNTNSTLSIISLNTETYGTFYLVFLKKSPFPMKIAFLKSSIYPLKPNLNLKWIQKFRITVYFFSSMK